MKGYLRLQNLVVTASKSPSFMAVRQPASWCDPVTVEIVLGGPNYFVGDEEVTASQAAEALEYKPVQRVS